MPQKLVDLSQILPGCHPGIHPLVKELWNNSLVSPDVAFSLAQFTASAQTEKLSAEQVILCIVSDYMGRGFKNTLYTRDLTAPLPF